MINKKSKISINNHTAITAISQTTAVANVNDCYYTIDVPDVGILDEIITLSEKNYSLQEIIDHFDEYDESDIRTIIEHLIDCNILVAGKTDSRNEVKGSDSKEYRIAVVGANKLSSIVCNLLHAGGHGKVEKLLFHNKENADEKSRIIRGHGSLAGTGISSHTVSGSDDIAAHLAECDIVLLCGGGMTNDMIDWINQACWKKSIPCVNGSVRPTSMQLGPTVIRGTTPCFGCYLSKKLGQPGGFGTYGKLIESSISAHSKTEDGLLSSSAHMMVTEATNVLHGKEVLTQSSHITMNFETMKVSQDFHKKASMCPTCSKGTLRVVKKPEEIIVPDTRTTLDVKASDVKDCEAGIRSVPMEDALRIARDVMQKGVSDISQIRAVDDYDRLGIPVYFSERNEGGSWGKGFTREQAFLSAVFESIERFSSAPRDDINIIRAPYRVVKDNAIDMENLLGTAVNNGYDGYFTPFTPDLDIDWVWASSLTHSKPYLVPAELTYLGYKNTRGTPFIRYSANGLAAGMKLEDAVLQGFMEVIERDAHAITLKTQIIPPRIDNNSIKDPACRKIIDQCERKGVECYISNLTNDTGIYCFCATLKEKDHPWLYATAGYGAHLDPQIALRRALCESIQTRAVVMYFWYGASTEEEKRHFLANSYISVPSAKFSPHVLNQMGDAKNLISMDELSNLSVGSAAGDMKKSISMLSDRLDKLNVLVTDLTHPEIGVPVVRVLVEGLQIWNITTQYIHPRTLEVPKKLGYTSKVLDMDDLYTGGFPH